MTLYGEDLAFIHDAGFGALARRASDCLIDALRRGGINSGLVVDLGCGSGILSEALATAGYDVLGFDFSPAMIDLARRRVPGGQFRIESLHTASWPPCVAVAAVGECLSYLLEDDEMSKPPYADLFRRVHESLPPGGIFLFDVVGPGRVLSEGPYRSHFMADDWAVLVTAEEDRSRGILTRRITSFRKVGELYRRDDEVHRQHLASREVVAELLREVGFEIAILDAYGPRPLPPGDVAFLARKGA
jgi:SAM-dependent methyltransferase